MAFLAVAGVLRSLIELNHMPIWKRNCPNCDVQKTYKSQASFKQAVKRNAVCRRCASELSGFLSKYSNSELTKGELNSFYGKKHSDETKNIIGRKNKENTWSAERKQQASKSMSGEKNHMFGKNIYDTWVEKYGIERANDLDFQKRKRQSFSSSGSKNSMFGKPSPAGSGNGWSGWYKGWYFRSLRELSYVVNVLEISNEEWKTAESCGIRIQYRDWQGNERTYVPDFITNGRIVECKPKKLHNSPLVKAKSLAAKEYAEKHSLVYILIDPPPIDFIWLREAHETNVVQFTERYELKFKEWIEKNPIYT